MKTKILEDFSKESHKNKNIVLKDNAKPIKEYEFVGNLENEDRKLTEYQSVIRTVKNDEDS